MPKYNENQGKQTVYLYIHGYFLDTLTYISWIYRYWTMDDIKSI